MENPKIRFKGFTKDWEQRKLIDYLEVSSEKNRDNRFTKEDVLSVSGEYGIVNQIEFQGRSFAGASVSNYGVVENGDVVYTKSPLKSNPYGIIKTNKGIPGIVSTLYAVYKPKEITDSKFVQIYFELDSRMNSYMHPLVNKGAKNDMKVSAENALKGMVSFPKKDEQEMISLYFSTIDHLITLHQRKCEQTKKLKKYMLQKMFPRNGAKVPEIRFYGFTYDWEQRKFSDIASRESVSRESSYDLPSLEYEDVIAEEGRLNKDISLKENIKKGIVFDGSQVLYGKLRPYLHNWLNPDFSGVAVGDWWVLKLNNADKSFIYRLIQTQRFDDIANQSAGSKMPRADWNLVSNTEFAIPVSQEEQEKIGEYFSSLDHLITLHQRKCDELKKMKKYMLQNMFI
jgi:type I restriction enzyme S subunit